MIYVIAASLFLAIALIYGIHSFASYKRSMEPYGSARNQEFFWLIIFMSGFEAILWPIFFPMEIIHVLAEDFAYLDNRGI